MKPTHFLFFVVIYLISIATAYLIGRKKRDAVVASRYETIDGLRGLLAMGVFIHHATVWHLLIRTGKWRLGDSFLYNQFGAASVLLFFMITGFLFVGKLLSVRDHGLKWTQFYLGRFFRLVPVYLISVLLVFIIVFYLTGWQLNESISSLAGQLTSWLFFTVDSIPNINLLRKTFIINSGVTWSLAYEWFFYLALPLISLLILKKQKQVYFILISILAVLGFFFLRGFQPNDKFCWGFVIGAVPALLIRSKQIQQWFQLKWINILASLLIVYCLYALTSYRYVELGQILYAGIVFVLIALGCSFFGLLKLKPFKLLGDISYSLYLLHGIFLFTVFRLTFGLDFMRKLTAVQYSLFIFVLTPILIVFCYLIFRCVEKPMTEFGRKVIKKSV